MGSLSLFSSPQLGQTHRTQQGALSAVSLTPQHTDHRPGIAKWTSRWRIVDVNIPTGNQILGIWLQQHSGEESACRIVLRTSLPVFCQKLRCELCTGIRQRLGTRPPDQLDQFWKIMRQRTDVGLALGPQCFEDRLLKCRQLAVEIQKARSARINP